MGYEFEGRFELDRELTDELYEQLNKFSETRHGGNITPDPDKPGFWCDWVPTKDRKGIEWNGMEKFYNYIEWLGYLIEHFLRPNGYVLNGKVKYRGEDFDDIGYIVVDKNVVTRKTR